MKIIFSRKGFDSAAGGCPNLIFPDGKMLPLPIPGKESVIAYRDIFWEGYNVGEIVESVTNGKIPSHYRAHLDPDLNEASILRHKDWRPIFGQAGIAQGHLRKQGVGAGDLFLFFGLFQDAIVERGKVKLDPKSSPRHVIWGWLQVAARLAVDEIDRSQFEWAVYHPHFHFKHKSNTVYLAKKTLEIPGLEEKSIRGAGVFPQFSDKLQLTAPQSRLSVWKLPLWMFPKDKESALTYHKDLTRWEKRDGYVLLQTVARGQEFVLDSSHYPESIPWVSNLLQVETQKP